MVILDILYTVLEYVHFLVGYTREKRRKGFRFPSILVNWRGKNKVWVSSCKTQNKNKETATSVFSQQVSKCILES